MARLPTADVAIYLPSAGPLYFAGRSVGGAEHKSFYLARALAGAGLRVRHIVEAAPGQEPLQPTGGVEVVAFERPPSSPVARYRAIVRALAEADARIYIQFCASYETGVVGAWARSHRRPFVFASMSDGDFVTDVATARSSDAGLHLRRVVVQYRIGLFLASAIVVQTEAQRELARERFRIDDARVLRSIRQTAPPVAEPREAFLWIGRIIDRKDPFAYLELARRVPEARFWMLATERSTGRELAQRLRHEAGSIANLDLLPAQPNPEVLALVRRAVALVSTSRLEGFPNTFLEAWAHGTPVLSLGLDPDGVIEANALGFVAGGSIERLAAAARSRWGSRDAAFSETTQAYIRRVHDPEVIGGQWVELIRELLGG